MTRSMKQGIYSAQAAFPIESSPSLALPLEGGGEGGLT
jgi:hypothetical protein